MAMQSPSLICIMLLSIALTVAGHPRGPTKEPCRELGGSCQKFCNGTVYTGKMFCRRPARYGCCVPTPPNGCVFGNTTYPNEDSITMSCMIMQCISGMWSYTGKINRTCGECQVWGDPHFLTFDRHLNPGNGPGYYYIFNGDGSGSYTITQHGLSNPSPFGLSSTFEHCYTESDGTPISCVKSITYYEPGVEVSVILPSFRYGECYPYMWDPTITPVPAECEIQVTMGTITQNIGKNGWQGPVWVFKHWHYGNGDNSYQRQDRSCINIVGSKGLSVSLCTAARGYYSNLYVWAMEYLKADDSQLYGLCDTYTGKTRVGYTMQNGTQTNDTNAFGDSWKTGTIASTPLPSLDRCTNATVLEEIEDQCAVITTAACDLETVWQCDDFISSCVHDLCRMPNRELYAEGYAHHMRIHHHLYQ